MIFSFAISLFFEFGPFSELLPWQKLLYSVALTTVAWVLVTLATDVTTIKNFSVAMGGKHDETRLGLYAAGLSTVALYGALFFVGALLYGNYALAALLALITVITGVLIWCFFNRSTGLKMDAARIRPVAS